MPSYTSIINALFRLMPGDSRTDALKSVFKLHPHSENFSDPAIASLQLDEHTRAWQTRHALEACRGWKWPFWLNAQLTPASPAYHAPPAGPLLQNTAARDTVAIPGLPGTYAGTMDRRGMVTPPCARFSVEVWFRFGDEIIYPAEIFPEEVTAHTASPGEVTFCCETGHERLCISATAKEYADLRFIDLGVSSTSPDGSPPRPLTIYVSIRPYNTEGVSPLHDLVYNSKGFWMSESRIISWFTSRPSESWAGDARHGDAAFFMEHPPERTAVRCPAGMATAVSAFHFHTDADKSRQVQLIIPLEPAQPRQFPFAELIGRQQQLDRQLSPAAITGKAAITIEGGQWGMLLETANHQLSCLTDVRAREFHELFLHHNHWLVSAVRALLYQGHADQALRLLQYPALSIQKNGYMDLAGGKWGFQGQFLSALADYYRLTQQPAGDAIATYKQIRLIARWIMRKRREVSHAPAKPTGLLPPGVTRSGTGMEYQLADNFWALEGLESAAWLARYFGEHSDAELFKRDAVRYAAHINAAIHRELEYGLSQQVPGRLHRAFDPSTAAELLDIALMPESFRLLRAGDWLERLIDYLVQPIDQQQATHYRNPLILRNIDKQGVCPARRILLALAALTIERDGISELLTEVHHLHTPYNVFPQYINPYTRLGNGGASNDPEATALFTVLTRYMLLSDDDHNIRITPAMASPPFHGTETISMNRSATIHGPLSYLLTEVDGALDLDLHSDITDPTVDFSWCQPEPGNAATYPCHSATLLGSGKAASGRHTQKFPQHSNNPTS